MLMMHDYEEDLHDLLTENKERLAESLFGAHRAESRQINIQQDVGSRQRFHHSLMGHRPGLSMKS